MRWTGFTWLRLFKKSSVPPPEPREAPTAEAHSSMSRMPGKASVTFSTAPLVLLSATTKTGRPMSIGGRVARPKLRPRPGTSATELTSQRCAASGAEERCAPLRSAAKTSTV